MKSSTVSIHSVRSISKEKAGVAAPFNAISLTDPKCNEPLPQADSFTSSTALLAHSSLIGDRPVLTGGKYSFYWRLRARTTDNALQEGSSTTQQRPYYRNPPLIFKSKSAYGSFTFFRFVVWRNRVVSSVCVRYKCVIAELYGDLYEPFNYL
ncbi:hypothetical protein T05_13221, partial [Trichinella murrelli]